MRSFDSKETRSASRKCGWQQGERENEEGETVTTYVADRNDGTHCGADHESPEIVGGDVRSWRTHARYVTALRGERNCARSAGVSGTDIANPS